MTFRGVYGSRPPPPRVDVTHARQYVFAGLALITAHALPPGKAQFERTPARLDAIHARNWTPTNDLSHRFELLLPRGKTAGMDLARTLTLDNPIARAWQRVNDLPRQLQQTLPALQYDWPLPRAADSPLARQRDRVNDLPRQLQQTLPALQFDWPLPKTPLPLAKETPPLNAAVQIGPTPFASYDWPLARRVGSTPDLPAPNIATPYSIVVVVTAPFSQLDWPLPRQPGPTAKDLAALNAPVHIGPTPFAAYDWPLAKRPLAPAPETPSLNIAVINTIVAVTAPFAQFDWPLPARIPQKPLPVSLARLVVHGTAAVAQPFAAFDWPLPARPLPSAPETPSINAALHIGPTPFAFFDWTLAKPPLPPIAQHETPSINMAVQIGPTPFAFFDWTLPRPPLPPALETTITNVTAINTPVIVVPLPPALYDWPLPKNVPFVVSDTSPAVNPNIYPPESGAPNYLRRLIQTEEARRQRLAEQDRSVLRTMFNEGGRVDKQSEEDRLIEEDDEDILRFLDP